MWSIVNPIAELGYLHMEDEITADALLDEVRPAAGLRERRLTCPRDVLSNLDLVIVLLDIELASIHVFPGTLDELIPEVELVGVIPLLPNIRAIEVERLASESTLQSRTYLSQLAIEVLRLILDQPLECRSDLGLVVDAHDRLEGVRVDEMQQGLPLYAGRVLAFAKQIAP